MSSHSSQQPTRESTPVSPGTGGSESTSLPSLPGSEGAALTEPSQAQTPSSESAKMEKMEEKSVAAENQLPGETAPDSAGKKQRILIGSQRDPTLFTQYKPKPNLTFPEARIARHQKPRRPKSKRPRPPKQPTAASPEGAKDALTVAPAEPLPHPSELPAPPKEPPAVAPPDLGPGTPEVSEPANASLVAAPTEGMMAPAMPAPTTAAESTSPLIPGGSVAEAAGLSSTDAGAVPLAKSLSGLEHSGSAGQKQAEGSADRSDQAEKPPAPVLPPKETSPARPEGSLPEIGRSSELAAKVGMEVSAWPTPATETAEPTHRQEEPEQPAQFLVEPGPNLPGQAMGEAVLAGPKYPTPNLRAGLPEDLAAELEEALADTPVEQLLVESALPTQPTLLEPESQHPGRIVRIHRDEVFVELGGREQGVVPLKQFLQPPEVGQQIEVIVNRFVPEEGLYELTLPASAAVVAEWAQLAEGMLVEARVTGQNTGGLECELGHIRGFIPISMVDLYRVADLTDYVGQKFLCKVIECNPQRGNLVLSRRAVLEQQRQEARQQLLSSLAPGQIREGVVRKLMNFGAFVDLGQGVDGLIPISQMSWRRIGHPSEVLQEGQPVQVVVEKVDPASGRISLSLRELQENPWTHAAEKYPPNSLLRGIVRRVMDYGAFVELEPGLEGLVHISELSHKRVWRARDVVQEGQEVEVLVLSVDPAARRISLSIRQALPPEPPPAEKAPPQASGEPTASESASEGPAPAEPAPLPKKLRQKKPQQLKGGLGRSPRSSQFGLNW